MRNRKKRREIFFKEHPNCCFCAGKSQAVEEDHFPSRSLFDDRQWPEGYVFPACNKCNHLSSKEETIIAFLSRIGSSESGDKRQKEVEMCARSLAYNYPGLLEDMLPTARQARNAIKEYGSLIPIPLGEAVSQAPILATNKPLINDAFRLFGRKLLLALYYKHTGIILPRTGGVASWWGSDLQIKSGDLPIEQWISSLSGIPIVKRNHTSVGQQFFYQYGITECKEAAGFVVRFRQSLFMLGVVYMFAERMEGKFNDNKIYQPFMHDAQPVA